MTQKIKKLFGTDGIRGIAGRSPLTLDEVYRIGVAAGLALRHHVKKNSLRVILVRDTRQSGRPLGERVAEGLRDTGIDVYDAGVLCTPSVAYLVLSPTIRPYESRRLGPQSVGCATWLFD